MNRRILPFIVTTSLLLLALFAREWIEARQGLQKMVMIPFEKEMGGWKGTDLRMDAAVAEMLNADQIVFERYEHPSGRSVDLYGAFYGSQGANRTMHSPLNCYPGSGWEVVANENVRLKGLQGDDRDFKVRKLILRKGLARRLLYYWYYAGGKTASNQYMNKLLTLYGALFHGRTDGGLVTVATIEDEKGLNERYLENNFIPVLLDFLSKQPITH